MSEREDPPPLRFSSENWFQRHVAHWEKWFGPYKGLPEAAVLEIGSYEGRSAIWLLDNVLTGTGAMLYCVDPFDARGMSDCAADLPAQQIYDNFNNNVVERYKNVVHLRMRSQEAFFHVQTIPVCAVYVDGSHRPKDVIFDALMTWPMLLPGGLMIFDDYLWNGPDPTQLPRVGIEAFLSVAFGEYELLHKGVQVALRKL